jgi:predicted TIM-barrel fold metal-dependent hydrolase
MFSGGRLPRQIACGVVGVILLSSCGAKPDQPGVEVDGQRLVVVDMHLHTGTWDLMTSRFQERVGQNVPRGFKWLLPWFATRQLGAQSLLAELDKAGIRAGGVFALYSPHTTGIASNAFVAEQIATDPDRLFGFASIRVDQWNVNGREQLQRFEQDVQREHFIGVKLAHAHQQFRFDDERFYPIYEIAGRLRKPVYLHTGTSPNPGTRTEPPYVDPAYLEEAIRRYSRTVFILGHSGYDSDQKALTYTDSAIRLARQYDNVWLETGALGAERASEVLHDYLKRLKAAGVARKTIYGSDGPQRPGYAKTHLLRFAAAMREEGYSVDEQRLILADNFSRVFGLPNFKL